MRRKALKQKRIWNPALFGIRNPLSWNPESRTRNPESTSWNPESKTVMDSLTWGDWQMYFHISLNTSVCIMVSLNQTFYWIHNVINSLRIQPSLLTPCHHGHFDGRSSLRETSLVALPRSLASQVFGKRKTRLPRASNEYRAMDHGNV